MKALLRRLFFFVLSVAMVVTVGTYIIAIYYHNYYYLWHINRWMISLATPCILLVWWAFLQFDKDYCQLAKSNGFKRLGKSRKFLLGGSLAFVPIWMITYFLIFTQTKLFGLTWVSDNFLMMLNDYGWLFCWLAILLLSDKSTPFYATTGFLFSGMVEFLGLFLSKTNAVGFAITEQGMSITGLVSVLFLHHLVPVYIGAALWLGSGFLLKKAVYLWDQRSK